MFTSNQSSSFRRDLHRQATTAQATDAAAKAMATVLKIKMTIFIGKSPLICSISVYTILEKNTMGFAKISFNGAALTVSAKNRAG